MYFTDRFSTIFIWRNIRKSHETFTKKKAPVRAGEWDTQTARNFLPFVESNVASITTNKNLHLGTGTYNIALLFLKSPIENDNHINLVKMSHINLS